MSPTSPVIALGQIKQLGYVTDKIEETANTWVRTFGAGPFYLFPHVQAERILYHGEPVEIDFSVAIGYWQDIQIELIEQHNPVPSIYWEWLEGDMTGIHHMALFVDDMTAARKACRSAGASIVQDMLVGEGEGIYVRVPNISHYIEITAPPSSFMKAFEEIKQASVGWDRTGGLRSF